MGKVVVSADSCAGESEEWARWWSVLTRVQVRAKSAKGSWAAIDTQWAVLVMIV